MSEKTKNLSFENDFNRIKSIVESPKVYVSNYYDDICNQIDIKAIEALNLKQENEEFTEKIIQNQTEMIEQVKKQESECLANLGSSNELSQELNSIDLNEIETAIKGYDESDTETFNLLMEIVNRRLCSI